MITYPLLGFLLVTRSGVQGVCKPAYVLGAGIAELAARILICTFVPSLVNGAPIDANASHLAYASVCAADPGAWIAACIVLLIPTINIIIRKRHCSICSWYPITISETSGKIKARRIRK